MTGIRSAFWIAIAGLLLMAQSDALQAMS